MEHKPLNEDSLSISTNEHTLIEEEYHKDSPFEKYGFKSQQEFDDWNYEDSFNWDPSVDEDGNYILGSTKNMNSLPNERIFYVSDKFGNRI